MDNDEARDDQDEEPVGDGRHGPRNHGGGQALGERHAAGLEQIGFDGLSAHRHERREDVRRLADDVDGQQSAKVERRPVLEGIAPAGGIAGEDQEVRQEDQSHPPAKGLEVGDDPLWTDVPAQCCEDR